MNIQAEISFYPLKRKQLGGEIEQFTEAMNTLGLKISSGPMSSRVSGECRRVFETIGESFLEAAKRGPSVLVAKFSNACPAKTENTNGTKC